MPPRARGAPAAASSGLASFAARLQAAKTKTELAKALKVWGGGGAGGRDWVRAGMRAATPARPPRLPLPN
jgi:hypothetical protein